MDDEPLLELDGISKTYPSASGSDPIEVLRNVSLSVRRGELVVVAGRSGSGKTTLLNVAAGLIAATDGAVRWAGERIDDLPDALLRRRRGETVGVVFQGGGLISSLTAAENVAVPTADRGAGRADRERAMQLLRDVGVGDRSGHFPFRLSGGEQQRVGIARALFRDASILLVDEPTANLDRRTSDRIIVLLRDVASRGKALLVASHDQELIERADRVHHLD